jgi:hypothetical protein
LSIDVDVPATAVTTDIANDTRHNFAANVDGGPPLVYAGWDANQRAWQKNGLADTQPHPDLTTMRCVIAPDVGGGDRSTELPPAEILVGRYSVASGRMCTSGTGSTGSTGLSQK